MLRATFAHAAATRSNQRSCSAPSQGHRLGVILPVSSPRSRRPNVIVAVSSSPKIMGDFRGLCLFQPLLPTRQRAKAPSPRVDTTWLHRRGAQAPSGRPARRTARSATQRRRRSIAVRYPVRTRETPRSALDRSPRSCGTMSPGAARSRAAQRQAPAGRAPGQVPPVPRRATRCERCGPAPAAGTHRPRRTAKLHPAADHQPAHAGRDRRSAPCPGEVRHDPATDATVHPQPGRRSVSVRKAALLAGPTPCWHS